MALSGEENTAKEMEQNWETREKELLDKITVLENVASEQNKKHANAMKNLQQEIKSRNKEMENYKNKIKSLEEQLADTKNKKSDVLSPAQQSQVEKVKQMSEEMLTKAKGVIFDKTKICKNQELQIEALTSQVDSLKEVLSITKNLLEIRNLEADQLEEKLSCMEAKIVAERERRDLMDKKLDTMVRLNEDLKDEYKIQLRLFDALKTKYHQRDQLLDEQKVQQDKQDKQDKQDE